MVKLLGFTLVFFLFLSCTKPESELREEPLLQMSMLNVGQGVCVVFWRDTVAWLVDTGPKAARVVDSLLVRGIRSIEWIVVSHWHEDHMGGLVDLVSSFPVENIWENQDTSLRVDVAAIRNSGLIKPKLHELIRDDYLSLGRSAHGRVIWPKQGGTGLDGRPLVENAGSIVLDIEGVLLPGDISMEEEKDILLLEPSLTAQVLMIPHHGSSYSSSMAFLGQVAPDFLVISVGDNDYGHPDSLVLRRLAELNDSSGMLLWRTDQQGSLNLEREGDLWWYSISE